MVVAGVGEAEEEAEGTVEVVEEAVPDEAARTKMLREVVRMVPEGRDTPPIRQKAVVNAIMFMETRLGTAWPPPPAPGPTSAHPSNEIMTSLEEIKKKF